MVSLCVRTCVRVRYARCVMREAGAPPHARARDD